MGFCPNTIGENTRRTGRAASRGGGATDAAARLTTWSGPATVRAYPVAHGRDGTAQQELVVLDTGRGRALARVLDPELLVDAESRELVGESVQVSTDGHRNLARW